MRTPFLLYYFLAFIFWFPITLLYLKSTRTEVHAQLFRARGIGHVTMTENLGPQAAGAAYFLLGLTWLLVSLRCYCKIELLHQFGPEDYLCLITQVILSCNTYRILILTWRRYYLQPTVYSSCSVSTMVLESILLIFYLQVFLLVFRYLLNRMLLIYAKFSTALVVW